MASGGPASLDEMDGKVVGVDTGSTGDMWATEHSDEYGFSEIRRYEGLDPAMLDLAAGRIDGYISDIPALLYYSKDKPKIEVVQRIETGEQVFHDVRQGCAELASEVNEVHDRAQGRRHRRRTAREMVRRGRPTREQPRP